MSSSTRSHPVHEGRLFRWGHSRDRNGAAGIRPHRAVPDEQPPRMCSPLSGGAKSPFYRMLQTGDFDAAPPGARRRRRNGIRRDRRNPRLRHDRLCRHHQPLRRRRRNRRDGLRLFVMGDATSGRIQRRPYRRAAAPHAVFCAGDQVGVARAHDRHPDADLSRPRRRPARAERPHHARRSPTGSTRRSGSATCAGSPASPTPRRSR